jgi:FKBP-type peptidyl-prolyl cis-trans isomerase FklB
MKKTFFLILLTTATTILWAQTTPVKKAPVKTPVKTPVKPVAKPTIAMASLKTLSDSASYAIGMNTCMSAKQQNIARVNPTLISRGIEDVQGGKKLLLDDMGAYSLLNRYITTMQEEKANPSAKAATKPATGAQNAVAGPLKTTLDSVNYAIGMNTALFAKQQGIASINTALLTKGINDIQIKKAPLFDDMAAYNVMNKYIQKIQEEKSLPTIKEGQAFLAQNKSKPGVKTTASGLQYEVLREGTGIKPTAIDTFVCHYRGTLLNGTEFDASYNRNEPLTMPMNQVIRGWTEGLSLMPIGSKYKFYIPYTIAYGPFDNGAIPGGSMLIFEVEMLDVKKAAQP